MVDLTVYGSPPEDDGGSPIIRFIAQWKSGPQNWSTGRQVRSPTLPITIPNLTAGVAYDVRVAPENAIRVGRWSNAVTVTPPTDRPNRQQALIFFGTPPDGGSPILHFLVQWRKADQNYSSGRQLQVSGSPALIAGPLDLGGTYFARVAPVNAINQGPWSTDYRFQIGTLVEGPPVEGPPVPQDPLEGAPIPQPPLEGEPLQLDPREGPPVPQDPLEGAPIPRAPLEGDPIPREPAEGNPVPVPPREGADVPGPRVVVSRREGPPIPVPPRDRLSCTWWKLGLGEEEGRPGFGRVVTITTFGSSCTGTQPSAGRWGLRGSRVTEVSQPPREGSDIVTYGPGPKREGPFIPQPPREGPDIPRDPLEGPDIPQPPLEGDPIPRDPLEGAPIPGGMGEGPDIPVPPLEGDPIPQEPREGPPIEGPPVYQTSTPSA